MKLVQHPSIVRLYEVIDTTTKLFLILELGDYDMYEYVQQQHGRGLAEAEAQRYFAQIVDAIDYCHQLHVVHRDLKASAHVPTAKARLSLYCSRRMSCSSRSRAL